MYIYALVDRNFGQKVATLQFIAPQPYLPYAPIAAAVPSIPMLLSSTSTTSTTTYLWPLGVALIAVKNRSVGPLALELKRMVVL
ncbi:hypothetical protein BDA96_10G346800 [Sorghum bicolor]|jgi:hypothetical protein|uniref:Uncharacterized protein n=1 Tax=Sorghum bicolor TaxID=4558 RepID=A0A921Q8K6_SORBI|nr:hypothetical protein BDA96_10G346800 [Sorghum bicolor]